MVQAVSDRFEIRTFEDILRALRARPDWLAELRSLILTEELLELPRAFREFRREFEEFRKAQEQFNQEQREFNRRQEQFNQEQREFNRRQEQFNQEQREFNRALEARVKRLEDDVARLKGGDLERRVRDHAPAYFGRFLLGCRALPAHVVARVLDKAMEQGCISLEERNDALALDLAVKGWWLSSREPVLLAVEISNVVDRSDVERASRRATVLERAFGQKVVPVTVGRSITQGAKTLVEAGAARFVQHTKD